MNVEQHTALFRRASAAYTVEHPNFDRDTVEQFIFNLFDDYEQQVPLLETFSAFPSQAKVMLLQVPAQEGEANEGVYGPADEGVYGPADEGEVDLDVGHEAPRDDPNDPTTVVLDRSSGKSLGMKLAKATPDGNGLSVKSVHPGSEAERTGKVRAGTIFSHVNGADVRNVPLKKIAPLLTAKDVVVFTILSTAATSSTSTTTTTSATTMRVPASANDQEVLAGGAGAAEVAASLSSGEESDDDDEWHG